MPFSDALVCAFKLFAPLDHNSHQAGVFEGQLAGLDFFLGELFHVSGQLSVSFVFGIDGDSLCILFFISVCEFLAFYLFELDKFRILLFPRVEGLLHPHDLVAILDLLEQAFLEVLMKEFLECDLALFRLVLQIFPLELVVWQFYNPV